MANPVSALLLPGRGLARQPRLPLRDGRRRLLGLLLFAVAALLAFGHCAQSFWTLGKANPNVQTQTTTFEMKIHFCAPVMSTYFMPRSCSTTFWNGVGVSISVTPLGAAWRRAVARRLVRLGRSRRIRARRRELL